MGKLGRNPFEQEEEEEPPRPISRRNKPAAGGLRRLVEAGGRGGGGGGGGGGAPPAAAAAAAMGDSDDDGPRAAPPAGSAAFPAPAVSAAAPPAEAAQLVQVTSEQAQASPASLQVLEVARPPPPPQAAAADSRPSTPRSGGSPRSEAPSARSASPLEQLGPPGQALQATRTAPMSSAQSVLSSAASEAGLSEAAAVAAAAAAVTRQQPPPPNDGFEEEEEGGGAARIAAYNSSPVGKGWSAEDDFDASSPLVHAASMRMLKSLTRAAAAAAAGGGGGGGGNIGGVDAAALLDATTASLPYGMSAAARGVSPEQKVVVEIRVNNDGGGGGGGSNMPQQAQQQRDDGYYDDQSGSPRSQNGDRHLQSTTMSAPWEAGGLLDEVAPPCSPASAHYAPSYPKLSPLHHDAQHFPQSHAAAHHHHHHAAAAAAAASAAVPTAARPRLQPLTPSYGSDALLPSMKEIGENMERLRESMSPSQVRPDTQPQHAAATPPPPPAPMSLEVQETLDHIMHTLGKINGSVRSTLQHVADADTADADRSPIELVGAFPVGRSGGGGGGGGGGGVSGGAARSSRRSNHASFDGGAHVSPPLGVVVSESVSAHMDTYPRPRSGAATQSVGGFASVGGGGGGGGGRYPSVVDVIDGLRDERRREEVENVVEALNAEVELLRKQQEEQEQVAAELMDLQALQQSVFIEQVHKQQRTADRQHQVDEQQRAYLSQLIDYQKSLHDVIDGNSSLLLPQQQQRQPYSTANAPSAAAAAAAAAAATITATSSAESPAAAPAATLAARPSYLVDDGFEPATPATPASALRAGLSSSRAAGASSMRTRDGRADSLSRRRSRGDRRGDRDRDVRRVSDTPRHTASSSPSPAPTPRQAAASAATPAATPHDAEVQRTLLALQLERFGAAFARHQITAAQLATLSDDDLKEIGMSALGPRKVFLKWQVGEAASGRGSSAKSDKASASASASVAAAPATPHVDGAATIEEIRQLQKVQDALLRQQMELHARMEDGVTRRRTLQAHPTMEELEQRLVETQRESERQWVSSPGVATPSPGRLPHHAPMSVRRPGLAGHNYVGSAPPPQGPALTPAPPMTPAPRPGPQRSSEWSAHVDPGSKRLYYANSRTRETRWDEPPGMRSVVVRDLYDDV